MMKQFLLCIGLLLAPLSCSLAQSRLSVAPTYWFNYGRYTYQTLTLMASPATQSASYTLESSEGLSIRYHFTQQWDLASGVLYNTNTSHLTTSQFGAVHLITHSIQVPALLNYRSSTHRLAPYFSAGALVNVGRVTSRQALNSSLVLGVGIDYQISPKLSCLVQPTARYLLYNPAETDVYRFKDEDLYAFGLQMQLLWHLWSH